MQDTRRLREPPYRRLWALRDDDAPYLHAANAFGNDAQEKAWQDEEAEARDAQKEAMTERVVRLRRLVHSIVNTTRVMNIMAGAASAAAEAFQDLGDKLRRCESCGRNPKTGEPCVGRRNDEDSELADARPARGRGGRPDVRAMAGFVLGRSVRVLRPRPGLEVGRGEQGGALRRKRMAKKKARTRYTARKTTFRMPASRAEVSAIGKLVNDLRDHLKQLAERFKNYEEARSVDVDGPITVGRYGNIPVIYSSESTVRYRVRKGQEIDVRLEPGSHIWFAAAKKGQRLKLNLGNGVWFPVGGTVSVAVQED